MSFGASPSDIISVVTFCKALYRKCRTAGGEYDEISREVRGLHTVLRHLKYEVGASDTALKRDASLWGRELAPIIGDCDFTMRQLDQLLMKYGRLANNNNGAPGTSPTSPRVSWERVKFGSNEMDQLGGIRVKLISHKTSLTQFLDAIQLHQSGKMATTLDNHEGQLDKILDKVDKIATKMQTSGGSILTSYDDDDKEVWKQFRRELVAEGFSSDVLQQHKDVLRAYIREIDQQGLLEPVPVDPKLPPPPVGANTERWLEGVQMKPLHTGSSTGASEDRPPSFDSLNTPTDDGSAKEMVIREDNMKFPQSMKMERPKPESRRDISQRQLDIPRDMSIDEPRKNGSQRAPSPALKLIPSDEKDHYYMNTDGSSSEDSETDSSSRRSVSPSYGQIITTKNLMAMSQALTIRSTSPSSFRSQNSIDDGVPRSLGSSRPPKQLEYGTSPSQPGAIPIPSNERKSNDRLSGGAPPPRPLAPDAQGNQIPPDAKWTKISRRLVSPEVLDQDHRRYEARPEFVAVLGVLSRAEIQDLTARSYALRETRRKRHFPPERPPQMPPRPIPSHTQSFNPGPRVRGGRDTPSEEDSYDSCDSGYQGHRRRSEVRPKGILKNGGANGGSYTYQQPQQQPYPAGMPYNGPPSPVWSPGAMEKQPMFIPAPYYPRERGDREREREPRRRHSSPPREKHHHSHRDKKEKEKEKPKSRWKEQLTAASMGGAAVSLFGILSEAAEGL